VLFPFASEAQLFDSRSDGKPWAQRAATEILPDAGRVWKKDSERESREDRNYWRDYRSRAKARLLAAEQARTAKILSAARARAAAFGAFETPKRNGSPTAVVPLVKSNDVLFPQPEGWPTDSGALSRAAATAKKHFDTAATKARNTTQSLAEAIEGSLPATKNSATKTAGVILALLVIFLVPAVVFVPLALGFIKVRTGRGFSLRCR
jgi:hypothetical protein